MPAKLKFRKYQKPTTFVDPNRHSEKLKEIEQRITANELATKEQEELDEEEMESEEQENDFTLSEGESTIDIGRIDLSFPETAEEFEDSPQYYPPSYYTLSPKERLLLLYCENFRKQFVLNHPKRKALVLALANECSVQKFVCTSIRPTAFIYNPLIIDLEQIASFVADFIEYEPLDDPINFKRTVFCESGADVANSSAMFVWCSEGNLEAKDRK